MEEWLGQGPAMPAESREPPAGDGELADGSEDRGSGLWGRVSQCQVAVGPRVCVPAPSVWAPTRLCARLCLSK